MNNDYQLKKTRSKRIPAITVSDYADIHSLNAKSLGLYLFNDTSITIEFTRGKKDFYIVSDLNSWASNNPVKMGKMQTTQSKGG